MKRRSLRTKFDSKIIMDVGLAGLATRVLPVLINKFVPLDPTLYGIAAAGGTYLVGSLLKKPVMANAGIALGAVELVAPMIENLIGGVVSSPMLPTGAVKLSPNTKVAVPVTTMSSYGRLNDYVSNPTYRQDKSTYAKNY